MTTPTEAEALLWQESLAVMVAPMLDAIATSGRSYTTPQVKLGLAFIAGQLCGRGIVPREVCSHCMNWLDNADEVQMAGLMEMAQRYRDKYRADTAN